MAIHLGRPLPDASRDRPEQRRENTPRPKTCRSYLVLLPVGFAVPPLLPEARCALTAPFHPYPARKSLPGPGGLLSVALSLGSPPPAVNRHRVSVEPGLSSPAEPEGRRRRPSGHLTHAGFSASGRSSSIGVADQTGQRAGQRGRFGVDFTIHRGGSVAALKGLQGCLHVVGLITDFG